MMINGYTGSLNRAVPLRPVLSMTANTMSNASKSNLFLEVNSVMEYRSNNSKVTLMQIISNR